MSGARPEGVSGWLRLENLTRRFPGAEAATLDGLDLEVPAGGCVALARALASRPDVLLLDEPFSALDPTLREEMHELLGELRAAVEPTVLLVTHDRHEASVVADSIAVHRCRSPTAWTTCTISASR